MELEKLDNLNLGKENFSQEDIEDILGGVTEYDNYGIPDISCAGGSGSCKESCRDGWKAKGLLITMDSYQLNPDYLLRQDGNRVILYSKRELSYGGED